MAFFVLYGLDGPKSVEIRKATRPSHLVWLESLGARFKFGSPMMADDGATPLGSIVIIEAKDLSEAKATFAQDPYVRAGLWDRIDIRTLGQWNPK